MRKLENSVTIKSSQGDDTWTDPDKIPSGNDFTKQFSVRTETTKRGTAKIVVYCTLSSKQWLNNIKWNPQMMSFLKTKSIFINFDRFETKETASPGFFIELHPELTNKKQMAIILTDELCEVDAKHEEEYKKWIEKNEPQWQAEHIPIPKFHLQTTTRQFGNGPGRVTTNVIVMECAAEDAGYFKILLN
jgi:hypothetical protein